MWSKYIKSSKVKRVDKKKGIVVVELEIDMKLLTKDIVKSFKITAKMMADVIQMTKRVIDFGDTMRRRSG